MCRIIKRARKQPVLSDREIEILKRENLESENNAMPSPITGVVNEFNGAPTKHLQNNVAALSRLIEQANTEPMEGPKQKGQRSD